MNGGNPPPIAFPVRTQNTQREREREREAWR
uniref:Uncharacterized protein n=1 Tax=Musa acuminata subsp. malaccensis TaxID=214687 RepID=A0A804HPE9_MUSAM